MGKCNPVTCVVVVAKDAAFSLVAYETRDLPIGAAVYFIDLIFTGHFQSFQLIFE